MCRRGHRWNGYSSSRPDSLLPSACHKILLDGCGLKGCRGWLCAGDRRTDGLARHWVGLWGTGEGQNGSLKNPLNLHNPLGGPIHPDKRCSPYLHLVVGQCVKEPFSSMYLKFTMKFRFMFDNADLPNDLGWICLSIGRGLHFLVRMSTTLPVPSSHSHLNLLLTKTPPASQD